MNRKLTLYIALLVAVTGIIILIDSARTKPVDWTPSYAAKDKIPLGLYVLDKEAAALFNNQPVKKFSQTPYEYFGPLFNYDSIKYTVKGTYLRIEEQNTIDPQSAKELLFFAEHGNTVFLSMKTFPQQLLDTLKVSATNGFYYKDSIPFYFTHSKAGAQRYSFSEGIGFSHFDSIDTLNTMVLGNQEISGKEQANFIKVPFGNGHFLLHTQPAAFSNFHLLKGNHHKYAEKLLSHIPDGAVYWNAKQFTDEVSGSPLRYILQQPALKWTLYTALTGLVVFMLFNAKRKQRIIPEIPPLKNTTIEFTRTIGNLYFQEGNHHTIIEKKIIYFLEHIRNEYLIDTYSLDEEFIEKLHLKIGKPVEDIEKAVHLIKKHRHRFESTEADVIAISKAIEKLRS